MRRDIARYVATETAINVAVNVAIALAGPVMSLVVGSSTAGSASGSMSKSVGSELPLLFMSAFMPALVPAWQTRRRLLRRRLHPGLFATVPSLPRIFRTALLALAAWLTVASAPMLVALQHVLSSPAWGSMVPLADAAYAALAAAVLVPATLFGLYRVGPVHDHHVERENIGAPEPMPAPLRP